MITRASAFVLQVVGRFGRWTTRRVAESCTRHASSYAPRSLGHNLGLKVVGEGIETQEQLEFLRSEGCHVGQGFFLGRPQSSEELRLSLETRRISLVNRAPIT